MRQPYERSLMKEGEVNVINCIEYLLFYVVGQIFCIKQINKYINKVYNGDFSSLIANLNDVREQLEP